jgi:hypothetical protein
MRLGLTLPSQTLRPKILPQAEAQASTEDKGPTFKYFKKLPVELRIMIWKFAEPERMQVVHYRREFPKQDET